MVSGVWLLVGAGCGAGERPAAQVAAAPAEVTAAPSSVPSVAAPQVAHAATPRYRSTRIDAVPWVRQKPDFCGEACAASWLKKLGSRLDQDDVFAISGVDPALGRGAYTAELVRALKRLGFDVGRVYTTVAPTRAARQLQRRFAALHRDLLAGIPSIICTRYDAKPKTTEHFRLILGYDARTDEVLYHEPAESNGAYRRMKRRKMLSLWPLKYKPKAWTVIRIRLARKGPLKRPRAATQGSFSAAAYAQHVRRLKARLPRAFHIVIEPPFVVIGNGTARQVRRYARGTIRWAVARLKQLYFKRDPRRILDIYLFRDRASYQRHTLKLFGERPGTPFGFYSARHGALIMNIATGGGTLVHELVHPFVEANIPDCPPWLNEGLGSLYEHCGERAGRIVGFTNWRLPGLQQAIRKGRVPSFKWLMARTETQFYQHDPGTNYSQSRYLCYYLQQRGLLLRFYHAYLAARPRGDKSGYKTFKKVLGLKTAADVKRFEKRWRRWAARLKYR